MPIAVTSVPSGSSLTFPLVSSGNELDVYGVTEGAAVDPGGLLVVEAGGQTNDTTVNGGNVDVYSGGRVGATNIVSGVQHILAGGYGQLTYIHGGTQFLDAGATESYVQVYDGGIDHITGNADLVSILGGGTVDLTQQGYSSGSTLTDPVNGTTSHIGGIDVSGGDLRIEAGVPDAIRLTGGRITLPFLHYDRNIVVTPYDSSNGRLTISNATQSYSLTLQAPLQNQSFAVTGDATGNTTVQLLSAPVCFCSGARIATPKGEVCVEQLTPGLEVLNARGQARPIRWIGGGRETARGARRPIIIRAGAFADGVPSSDLRVTPGHSFFFDDMLIPIEALCNGRSILPDMSAERFSYFHVELDDHDVVIANSALAESYRDDGNRTAFASGLGIHSSGRLAPYAPIVCEGARVDLLWKHLSDRAPWPDTSLSDDPCLALATQGFRVDPIEIVGTAHVFVLPAAAAETTLVSRSSIPADLGLCRDRRRLGVAIRTCLVESPLGRMRYDFDDPALATGFHEPERDNGFRWTDGAGVLRWRGGELPAGARVSIDVGCRTRYVEDAKN